MDKDYWLSREAASLALAENAASAKARLIHYDLAGRYSVKAMTAETLAGDLPTSLPLPVYASGSNPSFDDADGA